MTDQKTFDVSNIQLLSIKLLRGSIENGIGLENKPKSYFFTISISSQIEQVKKLVRYVIEVIVKMNESSSSNPVASFVTEFIYSISDLDSYVNYNEEKKVAIMEETMGVTLVSISYSTLRGVLFTRTQGTALNGIILPVVDPAKLLSPAPNVHVESSI